MNDTDASEMMKNFMYQGIPDFDLPEEMSDWTVEELSAARRTLYIYLQLLSKFEAPISTEAYGVFNRLTDTLAQVSIIKAKQFNSQGGQQ